MDINRINDSFLKACVKGDLKLCKDLLKAGANINCTDQYQNSVLALSVYDLKICKFLVANGADIKKTNQYDMLPTFH